MERRENSETDSHKYKSADLCKVAKAVKWRETVSSTNGAGTTGHPQTNKKINLSRDLTLFTKITQNELQAWMQNIKLLNQRKIT